MVCVCIIFTIHEENKQEKYDQTIKSQLNDLYGYNRVELLCFMGLASAYSAHSETGRERETVIKYLDRLT